MFKDLNKYFKPLSYGLVLFLILIGAYKINMHSHVFTTLIVSFLLFVSQGLKKQQGIKFNYVEKALFLFLIFFNCSFLFKSSPFGFKELVGYNLGGLVYFAFANLQKFKLQVPLHKVICRLISIALIVLVFLQIEGGMHARVAPFFMGEFVYSNYPNALASFLLLFIPMYFLQFSWGKSKTLLDKVLLSGLLVTFFLTWSRGAFFAFIIMLAMMTGFLFIYRKFFTKLWKVLTIAAGTLLVTLLLANTLHELSPYAYEPEQRITSQDLSSNRSLVERFDFFESAIQMSKTKPIFGYGSGSFPYTQPQFQTKLLANSDHPHNVVLKLAAENGIPAAILFVGFLLLAFFSSLKHFTEIKESERLRYVVLLAATTGFVLHNMVDYNLNFIGLKILFFAFIGLTQNYNIFHNSEFTERLSFYINDKALRAIKLYFLCLPVILFVLTTLQAVGYYQIKKIEADPNLTSKVAQITPFKMQYAEISKDPKYLRAYPAYWPVHLANGQFQTALDLNSLNNFKIYFEYYQNQADLIEKDAISISELLKRYLEHLTVNTHQTVVTENPYYAIKLAELFRQEVLAFQLMDAYRNEIQKFNDRFQLKLLPKVQ